MNIDHNRLLVKIAHLYYEQDLTQNEIAGQLRLSRQKVQRLLSQAKSDGIVQIIIHPITGAFAGLEKELEQCYGLREALVVESTAFDDQQVVARDVGAAAAQYLLRIIQPQDSIVISWGGSLLGMVNALSANPTRPNLPGLSVIQGLGGLGDPGHEVHAADLTRRLAQALGCSAVLLPAPAVAGTPAARDAILADPFVQQSLTQARSANLALMGIGAPRQESILMRAGEIVRWPELEALQQRGAVGDINLHYFDKDGKLLASDLEARVIGLSLEEIRAINIVLGVAGGAAKVPAILGALRGNLINVLVTDHKTAVDILASNE
jgi:DNA-binding transcriptional regulator LsrR (DeoR family)